MSLSEAGDSFAQGSVQPANTAIRVDDHAHDGSRRHRS